jgi:hypothetical protein
VKGVKFEQLTATLTPSLDFGKAPQTPVDQVLDLLRELKGASPKKEE